MDWSWFSTPFGLLLTTLIVIVVSKVIATMNRMYFYWKGKGIPYMPNSLSSAIMGWKMLAGRFHFTEWCDYLYYYFPNAKYFGMVDFATPAILLRDPELIKDTMVKDFEHFQDHRAFVDENLEPLFGKAVFFMHGDRWKEMRNVLSPSFTASKMKLMFDLISDCAHDFANYFVEHPELCSEVELKGTFRRYTNDVIATAAFGLSVNSMKEQDNEFYIRGIEATKFSSGFLMMLKFIFLRSFPRFSKMIGLTLFTNETSTFFRKIVADTIKMREEKGIVRPDMIHLLMQAREKEGTSAQVTLDDIVSQAFIFFFAGFDTSSTLMCFVAHELAVHQDIQDRLREEIKQYLAEGNGKISYDSLSQMSYMDMVVSEALRKYSPVVILDRVCTKKYELPPAQPGCKSLTIEPGTIIMYPGYSLQRDPTYFPNPEKFDPERFSDENKDKIVPYSYLPFGLGPRKCIGNRFALMETKILLAHLLQKFTLKTTPKTVEPIVFNKKEFALQPVGGFWIRLEKRET
ncbi:cytochrome P450 9e2-like [Pogonomyrmex barbatus]|uniref:Cytochrome P450 9e2-like n=1 Tax=Pogonomyrmex barbatus TaxID=144034 RepID=A0A6I9WD08_9HYME|nr:cytochrome P450 9e2-like [Pogonomyrmex barbatus]